MLRIIKIIFKTLGCLFLVLLSAWVILLGAIQTKPVQKWVVDSTLSYVEQKTGSKIEIGEIEFLFPLTLHIKKLSIAKDGERLATIEKINLTCTYGALLEGRIILSNLNVEGIRILKSPPQLDEEKEKIDLTLTDTWKGNVLPFYIKVENLFLHNIQIEPEALREFKLPPFYSSLIEQSRFSLKGFISNNPFRKGIYSHLKLLIEDISAPTHPLSLLLHTQRNFVTLSFEGKHLPASLIENLGVDAKFLIEAAGPLQTWIKFLKTESRDEGDIDGSFHFVLKPADTRSPLASLLGELTLVDGTYSLTSRNEMIVKRASIKNEAFELVGKVHLLSSLSLIDCTFSGQTKRMDRINPWVGKNIRGVLDFNGIASGAITKPSFKINLFSPELSINNELFSGISAHLSANTNDSQTDGEFLLTFNYRNHPCQMTTIIKHQVDQLKIPEFMFDGLNSTANGSLVVNLDNTGLNKESVKGNLKVQLYDLNDWSFLFRQPVDGEVFLDIHLNEATQTNPQSVDCLLSAHSLHFNDLHADQITSSIHAVPADGQLYQFKSSFEGKRVFFNSNQIDHFLLHSTYLSDLLHTAIEEIKVIFNGDRFQGMGTSIKELDFYADLTNPFVAREGEIKFSARGINTTNGTIEKVEGETLLSATSTECPFQIYGRGFWAEKWDVLTHGAWQFNHDELLVDVDNFTGRLGPYPFKLLQPLKFSRKSHEMRLSGLAFQLSDALIEGALEKKGNVLSMNYQTNPIPTELFHFIAPTFPLTGRVSFKGALEGELSNPVGYLDAYLHHVQFAEEVFTKRPYMEGYVNFDLHGKGIQLKSSIQGIGKNPVTAEGTLPITLNLDPFALKIGADIPFAISLQAEGELDPYLHLFYNDVTNITGQTKIALNLSGQMDNPHIQGTVDLFNGSFESLDTGATYKNIEAHLEGNGSKVLLNRFVAHDSKQGSISAVGEIVIDKVNDFPFEFKITPSQIHIMDSDYASISVSGPLALSGNLKKANLTGNLTADGAVIHLEQALPKQIKHIDIKYVNLNEGEPHPLSKTKKQDDFIELNVNLKLPGNVKIEGKNFTSEWKGDITATGTPDRPLLNGDLRVVKGEYDFNGKAFVLTQGNIHFAGDPAKKTSLYIIAGKDFDRIHAEIIVKGPTSKPVVSFRSNPPLSQREVLSYILFNRGIADITSDQGDQLSQSFVELNDSDQSSSNNKDFLTRLRNNIGIDRLDITSSDSENKDVSLQVGKYITEKVFVSVNKSISDVGNRVAIEANIHKNLKAQAEVEVGGDTQGKVSLKWKKDY